MKRRDPKKQAFVDGIKKRAEHLASIRVFRKNHKQIMQDAHDESVKDENEEDPE